jgi:Trehalase
MKIRHSILLLFSFTVAISQNKINPDAVNPNWKAEVPEIIHPNKKLVALYYKTWEIAAGRIRKGPKGLAASPYMDENCFNDKIWIWDGCFMTLFCKYAPKVFPLKQTLLNYYVPLLDSVKTPIRIHLRDNPPLFSWVENNSYEFTGDFEHIDYVINKKKYLQRHFDYFNKIPVGNVNEDISGLPIYKNEVRDKNEDIIGYIWNGDASGMDNTPRGLDCGGYDKIMWIDAICQQALSALYISRLSEKLNNESESKKWKKIYDNLKTTINTRYWNEEDGFYYDVDVATGKHCKVKSMASYWALLAEIANPKQAERMVSILKDEKYFGVKYPFPSVSRDNNYFNEATGDYWRGGIWLPMAYMAVKGLEKYGYNAIANEMATNMVNQQLRTFYSVKPNTIWEVYNPNKDEPSTERERRARPDFCGWSALGPISLTIENILGFRKVDALNNKVYWDLNKENKTHGLRGLKFLKTKTNLLYDSKNSLVMVTSNLPYTLIINNIEYKINKGINNFSL